MAKRANQIGLEIKDELNQKIAEFATSLNFDKVYLIGKAFSTTNVKNAFKHIRKIPA